MSRRAGSPASTCPNREDHTPCPDDYRGWHAWAELMSKTHSQVTCNGCGLYAIWRPKGAAAKEEA